MSRSGPSAPAQAPPHAAGEFDDRMGPNSGREQMVELNPTRFNVLLPPEQEGWHRTVRQLLAPQGVQTVSVQSGREALRVVESGNVHVAVLDAGMPLRGGWQV